MKICIDAEKISVLDDMENMATCFTCQMKTGGVGEGDYELNTKKPRNLKLHISIQLPALIDLFKG